MRALQSTRLATLLASALLAAAGCDGGGPRPAGQAATLVQYKSCPALEADLKDMIGGEIDAYYDMMLSGGGPLWAEDGDAAGGPPAAGGERTEGEDYSGTNNQEAGVDEGDFVKTDGYHLYVLNANRLHIFGVPSFGDLDPESTTEIEGWPSELLVDRASGRAAVFSSVYADSLPADHPLRDKLGYFDADGNWVWRTWSVTKLTILDVSDHAAPSVLREVYFEGWYSAARKVDTSVRMITYSWANLYFLYDWAWWDDDATWEEWVAAARARAHERLAALTVEDLVPRIYERTAGGPLTVRALDDEACGSFYRPADSEGYGVASVLSVDLATDDLALDADHIVSNYTTVYASQDRLYLAEPAFGWWWFWIHPDDVDHTNIHAFDITAPGISGYLGSGRVDGLLFDQFSMDEKDGLLRVATTVDMFARWWAPVAEGEVPPPPTNQVTVLAEGADGLVEVGHLGGLSPEERIMSARFEGNRGYLVTYQQIDPLLTIDLANPHKPRLAGELEAFGFSSYLHPVGDDMLLAVGYGGDATGTDWRTRISLFDVSDFGAPALADYEDLMLDADWSWSEASWDHKAFQYWKGVLAVPLSAARYDEWYDSAGDWHYSYDYTSRLELLRVDETTGLSRLGSIDHSHFFDATDSWYDPDVRRSLFMGDFIYAFSDRGITVNRSDDLTLVAEEPLPGWYYGGEVGGGVTGEGDGATTK